jgi:hypothetical protein
LNLFNLVHQASEKLTKNNLEFNEQSDLVVGILRATGVVPHTRTTQNGHLHKLLSATLVLAHNLNESIQIPTRKLATYYERGVSTRFLVWLDSLVQREYLLGSSYKAEGELKLSKFLSKQINNSVSSEESMSNDTEKKR